MNNVAPYQDKITNGEIDLVFLDFLDRVEADMANYPPPVFALNHLFTPGLYTRECIMEAGQLIISQIHKTKHPYFVMYGHVQVLTDSFEVLEDIVGPTKGITYPGTRRLLKIIERTSWITSHPTAIYPELKNRMSKKAKREAYNMAIEKIAAEIIEKRDNKYLNQVAKEVIG